MAELHACVVRLSTYVRTYAYTRHKIMLPTCTHLFLVPGRPQGPLIQVPVHVSVVHAQGWVEDGVVEVKRVDQSDSLSPAGG